MSSDNSKVQHHHHIFCKRAGEQKMTLDFILCQSTKGTKKVEMKNASLKAFQMTNLVQQQRRRGSRAGSRFCADLHKSSNEFWVWNEARPDFPSNFFSYEKIPADWSMSSLLLFKVKCPVVLLTIFLLNGHSRLDSKRGQICCPLLKRVTRIITVFENDSKKSYFSTIASEVS